MKGSKILIMGLAYKANVDDDRESPSYRLMEKLEDMGGVVDHDPFVPVIRVYPRIFEIRGEKIRNC